MTARDHLHPQLFEPGRRSSAPKPDRDSEVQEQLRGADLIVRAPEHALPGILGDGYLKTQHETTGSGGGYAPDARALQEAEMGFTDNPVYGMLVSPVEKDPFTKSRDDGEHYGSFKFTMKNSVRDRTTVTDGDSWMESTRKPENHPVPLRAVEAGQAVPPVTMPDDRWGRGHLDYFEAQIHNPSGEGRGRLPLSDVSSLDVDHMDPESGLPRFVASYPELGQQFQDAGVSTWHNVARRARQHPLPFTSEELDDQGFLGASAYPFRLSDDVPLAQNPNRMENVFEYTETYHQNDLHRRKF